MRISYCSSAVCSSDLRAHVQSAEPTHAVAARVAVAHARAEAHQQPSVYQPDARIVRPRQWCTGHECHVQARGDDQAQEKHGAPRHITCLREQNAVEDAADARDPSVEPQQRSEEHTSELQSLMRISYAVFCLKKKKKKQMKRTKHRTRYIMITDKHTK